MKKQKTIFLGLLILLPLTLIFALGRLYCLLGDSLDENIQVAVIAIIVIVLLGLFLVGFVLSWAAQHDRQLLKKITRQMPWVFFLLNAGQRDELVKTLSSAFDAESNDLDKDMVAVIRKPGRRGRKSNYPYKARRSAVLTWENRGPNFPFTLPEFLNERFGSSPTGVPNVPTGTFYDWRKDILSDMQNDGNPDGATDPLKTDS